MAKFDLVIRGGTIATASDVFNADIGIIDGKVAMLGVGIGSGQREIDATNRLVLPGGIDTHCHIEEPEVGEVQNADSFTSATSSAAAGGTTSVISFCTQEKGGTITGNLRNYHQKAKQALIDYGFHLIISDPSPEVIEELPKLIGEGHRSLKVFLTYDNVALDDAQTLQVLAVARRCGALVCVHAENHAAIGFLTEALERAGLTRPEYHAWAKPIAVEREACHRVITLAELLDTPVHIFHVSGSESAEEIRRAQDRGLKVTGETCPQYLVLTEDDLRQEGFEGAKYLCSPAPRTVADQELLWQYLRNGTLSVISSDHAPNRFDDKHGKKVAGENAPFSAIPNGLPGLETRLPLLFSEGVAKGRISLQKFVALTATNPAYQFGLQSHKGTIAIGYDADIAVWDPQRKVTIRNADLNHQVDYTPYEGFEVTGWPEVTISRGEVVYEKGRITGQPGHGRFQPQSAGEAIRPGTRFVTPFDPVLGTETS